MGLIKSGIKYGAIFMVAKEGLKAYENHKQKNQSPPQGARSAADPSPYYMQPAQQSSDLPRNASGSFHQPWCSGQCGGQCIPAEQWKSLGVDMPAAPAYADTPAKY